MASNLNYKQVQNVTRRTWDTETYEKRAKARTAAAESAAIAAAGGGIKTGYYNNNKKKKDDNIIYDPKQNQQDDNIEEEEIKEEFTPAAKGAAGPQLSDRAFLKARKKRVDVDSKIGSVEFVNPEAVATTSTGTSTIDDGISIKDGVTKSGVGWHCKVCDCFLKDSHTYLDHINGRKHQRNLGYSMRVERSTKSQVVSRLKLLAKEKEESEKQQKERMEKLLNNNSNNNKKDGGNNNNEDEDEDDVYHQIVKAKDEELKRRKEEKKRLRKERKKLKKKEAGRGGKIATKNDNDNNNEQPEEEEETNHVEPGGIDPAMAAMMGFSGFGGSSKNC